MKIVSSTEKSNLDNLMSERSVPKKPSLQIDIAEVQEIIDQSKFDAAEHAEFLQALWSVIVAFVDLGYGVHPTQMASNSFDVEATSAVLQSMKTAA